VSHFHHMSMTLGSTLSRPAKYTCEETAIDTHNQSSCQDISELLQALRPSETFMRQLPSMCRNTTTGRVFKTESIMMDSHRSTKSSGLPYFCDSKVVGQCTPSHFNHAISIESLNGDWLQSLRRD
jgi:hypothetical protein